jgi:hypothetical protein
MLRFGEQLYERNLRDLEGMQLEPYIFNRGIGIGIGTAGGIVSMDLAPPPIDRMLYVDQIVVTCSDPTAASRWRLSRVDMLDRIVLALPTVPLTAASGGPDLVSDNSNAANNEFSARYQMQMLIPFRAILRLNVARSDTSAVATAAMCVIGWTIPPGNIARSII